MNTLFDINKEWKKNNLPVTNGILNADGTINRIYVLLDGRKRKLEHGGDFDLNVLLDHDEIDVVEIAISKKVEDLKNDITVYCGMGFMGGDGFIVVESKTNSLMKWCAFFEDSNPFHSLEIIDNKIVAYNSLDEKWIFDINNPVNVRIE